MTDIVAWVQEALPPLHDPPHRAAATGVKSPGHAGAVESTSVYVDFVVSSCVQGATALLPHHAPVPYQSVFSTRPLLTLAPDETRPLLTL